jgi:hypothetical protein
MIDRMCVCESIQICDGIGAMRLTRFCVPITVSLPAILSFSATHVYLAKNLKDYGQRKTCSLG